MEDIPMKNVGMTWSYVGVNSEMFVLIQKICFRTYSTLCHVLYSMYYSRTCKFLFTACDLLVTSHDLGQLYWKLIGGEACILQQL